MKTIYAGVDVDQVVKLFFIEDHKPILIRLQDWWKIQDELGTEPGEMLNVTLWADDRNRMTYREFLQRAIQARLPPGSQVAVQFDESNLVYHVEATVPGMTHPPATMAITLEFVENDRFRAADFATSQIMKVIMRDPEIEG